MIDHSRLSTEFVRRFGAPAPTHLARAPGRVNLIGEHTDYCGLPVFPMALRQSVRILFRAREDAIVRLANVDPRFEPREFEIAPEIPAYSAGDWGNYVKAAAAALGGKGLDGVVLGDVPAASGLSSSSALVVASALAFLAVAGTEVGRTELMELCARAERYVGTRSGGMDQAISIGGVRGCAVLIEFEPLKLRPTPVPDDWRFVVANTGIESRKAAGAQATYNTRVRECREALVRVAPASSYRDLVARRPVGELLELSSAKLADPLRRRFRHVVTEAARVEDARAAMLEGDLEAFGRLMNASHASLRDDYEVSCEALDRLAARALECGSAGARLTGAGLGGCVVALCRAGRLETVLRGLGGDPFVAEPSEGARVFEA